MIIFIIFIIAAAVLLFLIFPAARRHPDREKLSGLKIAHRGLHDLSPETPENSLPAILLAAQSGFGIEIDLRLTADGEVVVFHDEDLLRACGDKRKIEELTLSEIKSFKLFGTNERVLTLSECLSAVGGRAPLLIEIKVTGFSGVKKICSAANEILKNYNGVYFIQSFFPPVLYWYRRHAPYVLRGQLASGAGINRPHDFLLGCLVFNFAARPDFISYNIARANNIMRRAVIKLGALSVGWTIKDPAELSDPRFKAFIFENFLPDREK